MKKNIFVLLRLKDWIKNIIIFFPILFSYQLFSTEYYWSLTLGFFTFCIISSFVYVLNDILDIEEDKNHPLKRNSKPLACNAISINTAYLILLILLVSILFFLYISPLLRFNIISYLILTLLYNFGFKKVPFIEIFILTLGYIIRADSGSKIIDVESSLFLMGSIFCIGSFFILLKRLSELNLPNTDILKTRRVLKYYKKNLIKTLAIIFVGLLFIIFSTYLFIINHNLILCFSFIILFLLRYYYLTKENVHGENPITLVISNKSLLFLSFIILISSLVIYL